MIFNIFLLFISDFHHFTSVFIRLHGIPFLQLQRVLFGDLIAKLVKSRAPWIGNNDFFSARPHGFLYELHQWSHKRIPKTDVAANNDLVGT